MGDHVVELAGDAVAFLAGGLLGQSAITARWSRAISLRRALIASPASHATAMTASCAATHVRGADAAPA